VRLWGVARLCGEQKEETMNLNTTAQLGGWLSLIGITALMALLLRGFGSWWRWSREADFLRRGWSWLRNLKLRVE
jgi:hypothetical protein